MILSLILLLAMPGPGGQSLLDEIASRYGCAGGIQWDIVSVVYSPAFDEAETTLVKFFYVPLDTVFIAGKNEKMMIIADTLWVLSKRHRQIQRRKTEGYMVPSDLILKWHDSYELQRFRTDGKLNIFVLEAREGVKPSQVTLQTNQEKRVVAIGYEDSAGNNVSLSIKKEVLERADSLDFFQLHPPKGYAIIDLTD